MPFAARLRAFARLPLAERIAFAEASALLVIARLLVTFVPPPRWRTQFAIAPLDGALPEPLSDSQRQQADLVARSIARSAHHMPARFVCLPQALAARWMLSRRGVPTELFYGTRLAAEEDREFHAWLKAGKIMVTGACNEREFAIFGSQRRP